MTLTTSEITDTNAAPGPSVDQHWISVISLLRERLPHADEELVLRDVAKLQRFTDRSLTRMQDFCTKVATKIVDDVVDDTIQEQKKEEALRLRLTQEQEISDSLLSIAAYFKSYQTRLKKFRAYRDQLHEFQFRLDVADRCHNSIKLLNVGETMAIMQRYQDVMSKREMYIEEEDEQSLKES